MGTECLQVSQCACGRKEKRYTSWGGGVGMLVRPEVAKQTDQISATPLSLSLGAGPQPNLHIPYLP